MKYTADFAPVFLGILLATGILLLGPVEVRGETLVVGEGGEYGRVGLAAPDAEPGDTILLLDGTYSGTDWVEDLHGAPDRWIVIRAEHDGSAVYSGGTEGLHLIEASWVRIEGLTFVGQTGNGMNIDDGGSYETPTHHIIIERCEFRDIAASGNNDLLKLSGVDSFAIRYSRFINGAAGGSGIDMVGCHVGTIESNLLESLGSSGIQAKGGTQYITIRRNRFRHAGARGINIGGSTGLQFFRPIDAPFEAADIAIHSNVFTGSTAPLAFVGSVRVDVTNNTIWMPENWIFRILQETVDPDRFVEVGEAVVRNNIIVIDDRLAREVNIGPNTRPETFIFSNNLWFHSDNAAWSGPRLPVTESAAIVGEDPLLVNPEEGDFHIWSSSPAVGAGVSVAMPEVDFYGHSFANRRAIGAAAAPEFVSVEERVRGMLLDLR